MKLYSHSDCKQRDAAAAILQAQHDVNTKIYVRILQASGTKGKRCAMPNTRIMMHQPAGGAMGSADEVNIQAAELNRTMKVSLGLEMSVYLIQTPLKCCLC